MNEIELAQEILDKLEEMSEKAGISLEFVNEVEDTWLDIKWKDDKKDTILFSVIKNETT